ncbi:MAG: hypothetical protein Q8O76_10730 [Chloroflexota bacterium]|nr:hypothetical protein [Chloroflexota bacterium]
MTRTVKGLSGARHHKDPVLWLVAHEMLLAAVPLAFWSALMSPKNRPCARASKALSGVHARWFWNMLLRASREVHLDDSAGEGSPLAESAPFLAGSALARALSLRYARAMIRASILSPSATWRSSLISALRDRDGVRDLLDGEQVVKRDTTKGVEEALPQAR